MKAYKQQLLDGAVHRLDAAGVLRSMAVIIARHALQTIVLSVPKVSNSSKYHGDAQLVGGFNDLGVTY
jgi:hypothetical protein